jgi:predicted transcriptional regulator
MDGATLMIRQDLVRRLDQLARRTGLTTTALANLLLEAAVNDEERRLAHDQRVTRELEAILVRAILRGDYDPATTVTHERSDRSGPPGEAQGFLAAATEPGDAGRGDSQPPLGRER